MAGLEAIRKINQRGKYETKNYEDAKDDEADKDLPKNFWKCTKDDEGDKDLIYQRIFENVQKMTKETDIQRRILRKYTKDKEEDEEANRANDTMQLRNESLRGFRTSWHGS